MILPFRLLELVVHQFQSRLCHVLPLTSNKFQTRHMNSKSSCGKLELILDGVGLDVNTG